MHIHACACTQAREVSKSLLEKESHHDDLDSVLDGQNEAFAG